MQVPPPKPKPPADLAEVERALSVLQGRHPEHERLRREDHENQRQRTAEIDAVSKVEGRRLNARRGVIGVGCVALVVIAASAAVFFRSELGRHGRIEQAADPFRAMGFTLLETTTRGEPSKLEATAPAGCVVATSTKAGARTHIVHPGGAVEGVGPVVTCFCDETKVAVTSDVKKGEGVVLLRVDARTIGGSRAFAFLPFKPGAVGASDGACAEASLDAWLDPKSPAAEPAAAGEGTSPDETAPAASSSVTRRAAAVVDGATSDAWIAADARRASLRGSGFAVVAIAKRDVPFAIVDVPAASCLVVLTESAGDTTSVRLRGGAFAVEPTAGNVAWCTSTSARVLAQREGAGELVALLAPASRAGGLHGVGEALSNAGLALGSSSVAPADRGWNAKQLLAASAIPETLITVANTPDLGVDPEARIVALSVQTPNLLVPDLPPDVFSFCDPSLATSRAALCVFSGPQKWRVDGAETIGGVARAKRPFWLFGLRSVSDPVGLKVQTELITLARRLRREGFEPTTLDAVTELDKGAEVLGRAHEDAMVVVAVAPVPPYAFPYSDGVAWRLDGEPRVVPIKPLERVTVTTKSALPPKSTRRSVVFRRVQR